MDTISNCSDKYALFEEKMHDYLFCMNMVKEEMYGKGNGNYSNLPGTCTEQVRKVTDRILVDCKTTCEMLYE